jgi:hypothetical protein
MPTTDRVIRTLPTLPTIGSAGSTFTDPIYGSRMARVTDAAYTTDLGSTGRSFRSPASGYNQAFNADGTKFCVGRGDGTSFVSTFDRTTMATARFGGALNLVGALTWDSTNANLLYGIGNYVNGHTLVSIDVTSTTFVTTLLLDLDTVTAGLNASGTTFVGAIVTGNNVLMCTYGGSGQEYMHYVLWYPLASPGTKKVIDTLTLNGMDAFNTHFTSHSAQIDKSGRYVSIIPTGSSLPTGSVAPYATYIWDTTADTVTPVTSHSGGHEVLGWGQRVNSDALTTFDGTQYILTPSLSAPMSGRVELINPLRSPIETFVADHTSWHNSSSTSMQPFVSGIYRYYDGPLNSPPNQNTVAWGTWDGEIVGVATDGSGTVTRFGQHRTLVDPELGTAPFNFWSTPRPNIDKQGRFAVFTSNWGKTLGDDVVEGEKRQDMFVIELLFDPARDQRVRSLRAGRGGRAFAR